MERKTRKDWSDEYGKAKNVWQYLDNHGMQFRTAIILEFDGEEAEIDIFNYMRLAVELIDGGRPNQAAGLLEAVAQILWEGDNPLTYEMTELPDSVIEQEVEKFSMTLDERLRKILDNEQDGNREGN